MLNILIFLVQRTFMCLYFIIITDF